MAVVRPLLCLALVVASLIGLHLESDLLVESGRFITNLRQRRVLKEGPATEHPTSSKKTNSLTGLRILVGIASYEITAYHKYLSKMLESFRDLCEAGSHVTIFIHTTDTYPLKILREIHDISQCRGGSMDVSLHLAPKSINYKLAFLHRDIFYDHLDDYDLFIYSEDDHLIRPRHVQYFLDETERIRNWTTPETFSSYSVGFIRYEVNLHGEKVSLDSQTFEFYEKAMEGKTTTPNMNYFHSKFPHQGMYLALPENLRAWRDRPNCDFDEAPETPKAWLQIPSHQPKVNKPVFFREQVSSLWLLDEEPIVEPTATGNKVYGCGVHQMIPYVGWQDSLVHHMTDRYASKVDSGHTPVSDIGAKLDSQQHGPEEYKEFLNQLDQMMIVSS